MRFLVEVVKDVKRKTGKDFPLGVRLSAIEPTNRGSGA